MLERGSKVFGCFLDIRKIFDTVGIDGLLYKLFSEFDITGRKRLTIKGLYTKRGQVLYSSKLSRKLDISQGTGQGRILALFMYKVYTNSLLNALTSHCYAISINRLRSSSLSFADDIALLALYPTFLASLSWACVISTAQSGDMNLVILKVVVTYGETRPVHFEEMKEREYILGDGTVDELYEYKNLGVLKNYTIGSFSRVPG